jgi:hypothetical protein
MLVVPVPVVLGDDPRDWYLYAVREESEAVNI